MFLLILMSLVNNVLADKGDFEGFIVGGEYANIQNYSHSAFISVECRTHSGHNTTLACGSSIVNQVILLTAGHCLESCAKFTIITVFAGNVHKNKGMSRISKQYIIHEKYEPKRFSNDIALVKIDKKLNLGKNVQRVVLMKEPPYHEQAAVAGWGLIDDVNRKGTLYLKHLTKVPVHSRKKCHKLLRRLPKGTFCAGEEEGETNYISRGDSGSALVVRHFIQIGVVSFKFPNLSKTLTVYTDAGYFYHWIKKHAAELYCKKSKKKNKRNL